MSDLERAIAFYQSRLGFTLDWKHEDLIAGASRHEARLFLERVAVEPLHPVRVWFNLDSVAEVDALHREWLEADVPIISTPEQKPWGLYEFTASDGDGNSYRVFHDTDTPKRQEPCADKGLPLKSAEQEIREVHATWIEAVNGGDLIRLLSLMTADAVFLNPSQAPMDRAGFSATFSTAHQQARLRCLSEPEAVTVVGELAYTRSRDRLFVTLRSSGETAQLAGHRLTIYRKQPEGRWLLASDAHTLSPVVP
ncbi:MAG TPA: SgcJ/EcaC family oxidoreductase [Candidatus Limnocylindria bacterium]|nr:SgcJ/EcaC family oxidoreductase [Candidatus Limnocylindria bacterium]